MINNVIDKLLNADDFLAIFFFFASGHSLMVSLARILKSLAVAHSVTVVVRKINISCHYWILWKGTSDHFFLFLFFLHPWNIFVFWNCSMMSSTFDSQFVFNDKFRSPITLYQIHPSHHFVPNQPLDQPGLIFQTPGFSFKRILCQRQTVS